MSEQVLPIARDDGYYLVDAGRVTFVPLEFGAQPLPAWPWLRCPNPRCDHLQECETPNACLAPRGTS